VGLDLLRGNQVEEGQETVSLPSFRNPPITEVVVSVAFRDAPALSPVHLGDLWRSKWESTFPTVEEHPPYIPPFERLEVPAIGPTIALGFGERPAARLWFVTRDGQELLQVQKDWFACNWRKVRPGDVYDRWPARRDSFVRHLTELDDYVRQHGFGKITPVQCEVTYVNHVQVGDLAKTHGELSKIVKLAGKVEGIFLPGAEQVQVAATFVIRNEESVPVGRLHVSAQPAAIRDGGEPIFIINLTARGAPEGEGLEGALTFLNRGREWIVQGFADLTTPEAQEIWGRNE